MRITSEYMQLCHIHLYQKIARRKVARVNAALKKSQNIFGKVPVSILYTSVAISKL